MFLLFAITVVFAIDVAEERSWREEQGGSKDWYDPFFFPAFRLVGGALDLLVDVEEANLVHGGKFCNQVDEGGNKVDKEGKGCVVSVVGAKQKPKR